MIEQIVALDISTKSGWSEYLSYDDKFELLDYGRLPKVSEPNEKYPDSYVTWSYLIFGQLLEIIENKKPDVLVIEETSGGSKSAYSQKILEFIHCHMARYIKENSAIKSVYFQTETWRRIVGCKMTKEEKDQNKKIKDTRKKTNDIVIRNEKGKRIGKITRKHVNVRRANELLGKFLKEPFILAQEDIADACLLGLAYHMKKVSNEQ